MDRYVLSAPKRWVVRGIAIVFFVLGAKEVVRLPLLPIAPRSIAPGWGIGHDPVRDAVASLPEPAQRRIEAEPATRERFAARFDDPVVRTRQQLLTVMCDLPVIVILIGMGLALWRSTRLVPDAVESGLRWLAVVGWGCLALAIGFPLLDGVRTVLILEGVMPTPRFLWYDPVTGGTTYVMLLIAAGILAATWTISAGLKARRDMAEFV